MDIQPERNHFDFSSVAVSGQLRFSARSIKNVYPKCLAKMTTSLIRRSFAIPFPGFMACQSIHGPRVPFQPESDVGMATEGQVTPVCMTPLLPPN
jgi:hypothetical protein